MAKSKWRAIKQTGVPMHWFVSNALEWRTGEDLGALVRFMQEDKMPFMVFAVYLPESAEYEISGYQPVLEDHQIRFCGIMELDK